MEETFNIVRFFTISLIIYDVSNFIACSIIVYTSRNEALFGEAPNPALMLRYYRKMRRRARKTSSTSTTPTPTTQ